MDNQFCANCGVKFPEGAKFCPNCGRARNKESQQTSPETSIQWEYCEIDVVFNSERDGLKWWLQSWHNCTGYYYAKANSPDGEYIVAKSDEFRYRDQNPSWNSIPYAGDQIQRIFKNLEQALLAQGWELSTPYKKNPLGTKYRRRYKKTS